MLVLISPPKTMNDHLHYDLVGSTSPLFFEEAERIVKQIRKMNMTELSAFLKISEKLGIQNFKRFQEFSFESGKEIGIPAALASRGSPTVRHDPRSSDPPAGHLVRSLASDNVRCKT